VPTTNAVSDLGSAPLRYSALYVYAIEALGNANVSGNGIFGGNGSFSGTFAASGASTFNGTLTANGNATFNASLTAGTATITTLSGTTGTFSGNLQSGSLVSGSLYTDNVAVKHKKLTGTTESGGTLIVAHGLTASKILGVAGYIVSPLGTYYGNYNAPTIGSYTMVTWNDIFLYFAITRNGSNDLFGNRPATVIVMYEA
jgi:hypothetical protein